MDEGHRAASLACVTRDGVTRAEALAVFCATCTVSRQYRHAVRRRVMLFQEGQHTGMDTWTFSSSSASRTADDRPMTPAPSTQIRLPLPVWPPLAADGTIASLDDVNIPSGLADRVQSGGAPPLRRRLHCG